MSIYAMNYYSGSLQRKQNGEKPMTENVKEDEMGEIIE